MQIRVRLTLQFLMIVAGILLVAFFIIKFQFKSNFEEEYYKRLRWNAYLFAENLVGNKANSDSIVLETPLEFTGPLAGYYPENLSIYTLDGRRLYTYDAALDVIGPEAIQHAIELGEYRFVNGKFIALSVLYTNKAGIRFVMVVESFFDRVYVENLTQILSFVFLISITIIAIGGWLFARQALAPVSRIMNQVDALLPTDMSQRLEPNNQYDELSRLVITFNKLLDRIQQVFRVQKMFISNISHELKNPLNVIISQVEVTLNQERTVEEYKSTLGSVLADAKELNEIGDKLMQLARVNSDDSTTHFQSLRVDELIWQAKASLLKNHPEYTIQFEVSNLPEEEDLLLITGNEQLLRTALVNLMDNGCKFSPDKKVRLNLSFSPDGRSTIEITDKGPGIPEEELPLIFDPFYRSSRTASIKGSGIGLSLVSSIMKLHHIDLKVDSHQGSGTTFLLQFPAPSVVVSQHV